MLSRIVHLAANIIRVYPLLSRIVHLAARIVHLAANIIRGILCFRC